VPLAADDDRMVDRREHPGAPDDPPSCRRPRRAARL